MISYFVIHHLIATQLTLVTFPNPNSEPNSIWLRIDIKFGLYFIFFRWKEGSLSKSSKCL